MSTFMKVSYVYNPGLLSFKTYLIEFSIAYDVVLIAIVATKSSKYHS
jgi:hypothetical protein